MGQFEGRRLSLTRLVVLLATVAAIVFASLSGWRWFQDTRAAADDASWFGGYVDVTATPTYEFEEPSAKAGSNAVLAFVVADKQSSCQPSWGAAYSLDTAARDLDLDRRVARLRQRGGTVAVSFGGAANDELATVCTDPGQLYDAYKKVVDRYTVRVVDIDVEGAAIDDDAATQRRATALAQLQKTKKVAVWLTLPVAENGLTDAGRKVVSTTLAAGVELAGVNVMTMDYGGGKQEDHSLGEAAENALTAAHAQVGKLYNAAGYSYGPATVWRHLGATPMLGQNDVAGEIFTLTDAETLRRFARSKGLGRLSVWSLNRDRPCGANYPDVSIVSDACSGVIQDAGQFSAVLGNTYKGAPDDAVSDTPTVNPSVTPTDDPSTSPYPVWNVENAYRAGDRVVWHRNVYVAKYWTSGDTPDDPLIAETASPWRLVGPVLAGESPSPRPSLPAGTYPQWRAQTVYRAGERVMLDGVSYVAQWYTQGDSPDAPSTADAPSPWRPLTDQEVLAELAKTKKK
jgi:chitinase